MSTETLRSQRPVPALTVLFRDVLLLAALGASAYVVLALATHAIDDPGWSYSGSDAVVRNAVGRSGAWVADVLLSLFGVVAWVFPVALAFVSWRAFRSRSPLPDAARFGVRAAGFVLMLCAAVALASVHGARDPVHLPAGAGGIVGDWLQGGLLTALGLYGLSLFAGVGLVAGLTLSAEISWLTVCERLGGGIWSGVGFVRQSIERVRARRASRIEAAGQREKRREVRVAAEREKRPAPRIEKPPAEIRSSDRPSATRTKAASRQQPLFNVSVSGELPQLDLLDRSDPDRRVGYSEDSLTAMSRLLEMKLADFGVQVEVVAVQPGPVITRFEIQPAPGIKASRISGLAKDLARSLAVIGVRVVEVIPGKSVMGIEIPNEDREMVRLHDVLASSEYADAASPLSMALGKDIGGEPVVVDLAKMPHLLVAGTTGSGKSVGLNAMLASILFKATPEDVRMIMVDPKMLELSVYDGTPHLLTPVVTDMREAASALRWCVGEMERRYRLMTHAGVRNLSGFNRKVREAAAAGEPILDPLWRPDPMLTDAEQSGAQALGPLPLIVVVIDEFADMMMVVGKKVEELIARIAQKARAAGIHLILATQRPSVDVITGLIKANIPTRIAFQVSSRIDSRTILDQGGAEQLLGHGDMLYLPPGTAIPVRVHGAFLSDDEVHRLVADWKARGEPDYLDEIVSADHDADPGGMAGSGGDAEQDDPLYDQAVEFVITSRRASISAVQRKLRIGYNRAARLVEAMEAAGVVSEMNGGGNREVLVPGGSD